MTIHELEQKCIQHNFEYDMYESVDNKLCVDVYRGMFYKETYVFDPVSKIQIDYFAEEISGAGEILFYGKDN